MNIAIVDDEKIIREQICALVKAKRPDCFIETYASGGEFLTAGKKFEIVFLDIQMEGMDGIDTAR